MSVVASFRPVFEILVLWVVLYQLYRALKDSRGAAILGGLVAIVGGGAILLKILHATVLQQIAGMILGPGTLLVVLFQPELRTALAKLGTKGFFGSVLKRKEDQDFVSCMRESVAYLVSKHYGALIAICRKNKLQEYVSSGTRIDALCSRELIGSIFMTKTLLHDGAMIINDERIVSAGSILPVSSKELERSMGLRHRAGIGLAENSDAVVIIVSEETGGVSLVVNGVVQRNISLNLLCERLTELLYSHVDSEKTSKHSHS